VRDRYQEAADEAYPKWRAEIPRVPQREPAKLRAVRDGVRERWHRLGWPEPPGAPNWPPNYWWAAWFEAHAAWWLHAHRPELYQSVHAEAQAARERRATAMVLPYKD